MNKYAFILIALLGAALLGQGLTGMFAISQSCCFGPNCPADYLCDAVQKPGVSTSTLPSVALGIMLLGVSGFYLLLHRRHYH